MKPYKPLRGVRVASFEVAISLPAGTRTLAELGAEVVRIGRPPPGGINALNAFDGVSLNKHSVSIDLKHSEGHKLATRLIACADVVCSNFRPPVMRALGFDRTSLYKINSNLIVLQLSGFGTPGPWSDFPAFGPGVEAIGGINALIGEPGDPPIPVGSNVYADQVGGRFALVAILAALEHRQRTGEGQFIDLSMYESIVHLLGPFVFSAALTGRVPERTGNRNDTFAPEGIYPAKGEDQWIAVSITTKDQWRSLCDILGRPELCVDTLDTPLGRACHYDEIDAAITAWTQRFDKHHAAALLQARGIPAGPVQTNADMLGDPHLAARKAFQMVPHAEPVLDYMAHPHLRTAWKAEGFTRPPLTDARPDGVDNRRILKRWLGMNARDVRHLESIGALANVAGHPLVMMGRRSGGVVDPHFAERLGLPRAESQ